MSACFCILIFSALKIIIEIFSRTQSAAGYEFPFVFALRLALQAYQRSIAKVQSKFSDSKSDDYQDALIQPPARRRLLTASRVLIGENASYPENISQICSQVYNKLEHWFCLFERGFINSATYMHLLEFEKCQFIKINDIDEKINSHNIEIDFDVISEINDTLEALNWCISWLHMIINSEHPEKSSVRSGLN